MQQKNKMRYFTLARWNLFYKSLFLFALAWSGKASAIQIHALYTASCQREVGVILNVRPRELSLLTIDGKIINVQRYEVIYLATYSLDKAPIKEVQNPEVTPMVDIKTMEGNELKTLVQGWAVDFSKDKIAFLNLRGSEIMIDRTSIWEVNFDQESKKAIFENPPKVSYDFIHPYAFTGCPTNSGVKVMPQQLLSNPIAIKKEFDRLQEGYAKIIRYESDQQFYPVPEVYTNETALGLWLMAGSRYGASKNRKNNFAPYLVDERSEGPFGFQSLFKTGSGPILQSIHEETQTQVYYRMKADYFHFTGMVDPNLLLVGSKYNWAPDDMSAYDIRANETSILEMGFDYKNYSIEFYANALNMGARSNDYFKKNTVGMTGVGLRYQSHRWILNLISGSGEGEDFKISSLRVNIQWMPNKKHYWILSVINKNSSFSGFVEGNSTQPYFSVDAKSLTLAGYGYWQFKKRYWGGLMLSAESIETLGDRKMHPKMGALIALSF